MQKKLIVIFLSAMLVFQHSFSFIQAQSSSDTAFEQLPPACSAPPPLMLQYQQFQNEMASALLGGAFGEKKFESEVSPMGWFTSKVLSLPTTENNVVDTILSSLWNNTRRLAQATLTTAFLLELAALSVVGSNLGGFAILFADRAIVRDWKTLLQIETKISQIAYYLGKTANITVPLADLSSLHTLVAKHQEIGLFTGMTSSSSASYADILADLSSMNAAMKFFMATNNVSALKNYQATSLFQITFSPEIYGASGLQADYRPVRKFSACNSAWKSLKSSVSKAIGENSSAAAEAGDIIKKAAARLATAGKNFIPRFVGKGVAEKNFSSEELQQLRTIYGVNTSKMTVVSIPWWKRILTPLGPLKDTWNATKKGVKSLYESAVNTWTGIKEAFNNYKNQVKEAKDTQQQAKDKKNQAQQNTEQLVKEKIVLTDQEKQNILLDKGVAYTTSFDNELYVAYADSLDYVVEVYRQMEQNRQARDYSSDLSIFNTIITEIKKVEEEIGKQPNDEGTLRKSIKEICEHQCSNVGNKGCGPL